MTLQLTDAMLRDATEEFNGVHYKVNQSNATALDNDSEQGHRSWGRGPQYIAMGPCINRAHAIIKLQNVHSCKSVIKIMKCLYCLNCPKFDQLIIRKNHYNRCH